MEQEGKNQFNTEIRERTMNLAIGIRTLLLSKTVNPIDRPAFNQLLRSSSSVASNYRAATRGRSDAEFYAKICIVVEEMDETLFWLEYLSLGGVFSEEETKSLIIEGEHLVRLFSTIRRTMKAKTGKND